MIETFVDGRETMAKCMCACGNETVKRLSSIKRGDVKSCGCLKRERALALGLSRKTHGHASSLSRGKRPSPEYQSWGSMKRRCLSPSSPDYENYGGRGISVCDEWRNSFEAFLRDMGPRPRGHTLDRIDPEGDYTPENCRWATDSTQAKGRRKHVRVEYRGERMNLADLSRLTGAPYQRLHERIVRRGWDVERAVSEPVRERW